MQRDDSHHTPRAPSQGNDKLGSLIVHEDLELWERRLQRPRPGNLGDVAPLDGGAQTLHKDPEMVVDGFWTESRFGLLYLVPLAVQAADSTQRFVTEEGNEMA